MDYFLQLLWTEIAINENSSAWHLQELQVSQIIHTTATTNQLILCI
jgi:hypothetical protein